MIGRKHEIQILNNIKLSKQAEFVAVYGRRRIGKTFLIRETFKKEPLFIEAVGLKDGNMKKQIQIFSDAVSKTLFNNLKMQIGNTWEECFKFFTEAIQNKKEKIILFFDELPWLATPRSGVLQAIDHFWNAHWSKLPNFKFIVCGSAASWMLNNLVHAKGGLYNRLTKTIKLKAFTLLETKQLLKSIGLNWKEKQVSDLYLVTGGIPHYINYCDKRKSLSQNIDMLCFNEDAPLQHEFKHLFKSLFKSADEHERIIKAIAKHRYGISRNELLKALKLKSGGSIKRRIDELKSAGFIEVYVPYKQKNSDQYYRVIDEYSLFYLNWIAPAIEQGEKFSEGYWINKSKQASWYSWAGYAFESVCLKHTEQIRKALEIQNIACTISQWNSKKYSAQIDLLFDREDDTITLCEIKYSDKQFTVDKTYAKTLVNKLSAFEKGIKTDKQIFLCLISASGMKKNIWSEDLISQCITFTDLFT